MKTQITLIFLFLIHFSSFSQNSDAIPPEVILCDEFTEYVNSKQYIESDCSDEPSSEEFRKWIRYIHDLTSSVEKNGMLYGEKIGWREGKDGWEEITFNTIMANNCDGFKKLLFKIIIVLKNNWEQRGVKSNFFSDDLNLF